MEGDHAGPELPCPHHWYGHPFPERLSKQVRLFSLSVSNSYFL